MRHRFGSTLALLLLIAAAAGARGVIESRQKPSAQTTNQNLPPLSATLEEELVHAGFDVPSRDLRSVDFELPLVGGGKANLSSYRGKLVVLNFWASWCPACREEIPSMEKLYLQLKDKAFTIVAVDLDEPAGTVRDFATANRMTFPILLDAGGSVGNLYGARSIPTTYLIDESGGVLGRATGGRPWDDPAMVALFLSILGD